MSTRKEKIRKLRALARDKSAFANEAAVALTKAQALESKTAKGVAHAIAQLLEKRGLVARVRRRHREQDDWLTYYQGFSRSGAIAVNPKFDIDVSYLRNRVYIELFE